MASITTLHLPTLKNTMNKRLLILLIPVLGFTSCFKNDKNECIPLEVTFKAPDAEISALKGYLTGNGITTEQDPRGFFYTISPMGTGAKPNTCSSVLLDYTTKLLDGTTVDSNNNVTYVVNAFIVGWQEALPLLPAGSTMTLYLPPSLAYGSKVNGNVPANSNLVFNIVLKTVN
jgi:FKBP-type peptidyl-prolyl cis-trans isomerase FkpA